MYCLFIVLSTSMKETIIMTLHGNHLKYEFLQYAVEQGSVLMAICIERPLVCKEYQNSPINSLYNKAN